MACPWSCNHPHHAVLFPGIAVAWAKEGRLKGGHCSDYSQEKTWTQPPPSREFIYVPVLLCPLPSPLASPLCARARGSSVTVLYSGCPWEPFTWRSPLPQPRVGSDAVSRCWRSWKAKHQFSCTRELGAPCDCRHFLALSHVLVPFQAGQAEAAQVGAWPPSAGREGSCAVFVVEAAACSQFNHSSLLLPPAVENLIMFSELCKQPCQSSLCPVYYHETRHPDC